VPAKWQTDYVKQQRALYVEEVEGKELPHAAAEDGVLEDFDRVETLMVEEEWSCKLILGVEDAVEAFLSQRFKDIFPNDGMSGRKGTLWNGITDWI
jgi:hypothetical protein